jgi:hypothetical protein
LGIADDNDDVFARAAVISTYSSQLCWTSQQYQFDLWIADGATRGNANGKERGEEVLTLTSALPSFRPSTAEEEGIAEGK